MRKLNRSFFSLFLSLSAALLLPCCSGAPVAKKTSKQALSEDQLYVAINTKGRLTTVYVRGTVPSGAMIRVKNLSPVAVDFAIPRITIPGPLICPKAPPGEVSAVPVACSYLASSEQPKCQEITTGLVFTGAVDLGFYCGILGSGGVISTNWGGTPEVIACLNGTGTSCPGSGNEVAVAP